MAMRMWEITKFLIVAQIVIGLVQIMVLYGLFPISSYAPDQGGVIKYDTGDISDLTNAQKTQSMDYFDLGMFVMAGLTMIINIVIAMVTLLPMLLNLFHIPLPIAVMIQTMVYLEMIWGYAQWKAGRPGSIYE